MNTLHHQYAEAINRRAFLSRVGGGAGSLALAALLSEDAGAAESATVSDPLAAQRSHFPAKAKNIIYLHMVGAPSHLDLFDYKPVLKENSGKLCPKELIEGERFAFLGKDPKLMGTPFKFSKHGDAGTEFSELLPNLSQHADRMAVLKTLHSEEFNHGPAQVYLLTGFGRQGRPSLGSWLTYGLGSESRDLPAFVVLVTGLTGGGGSSLWGNGFLPSVYQGVRFRTSGEPVLFVTNPDGIDRQARKRIVDDIGELNRLQYEEVGDPEIMTRIASYELAYRMQSSVPELMDINAEPKHIHELYGTQPGKKSFANNCLLARRLVERGVRVVQLYDQGWDHHGNVAANLPRKCKQVDQPISALLTDLEQRGLLDETLVVWSAEFGRTPMLQGASTKGAGRDHHKDAFALWMAGGGVKGGMTYGKTDDLGFHITENPVHVNDFHATLLHLMGLDHERLTYKFQGRQFRLTDVGGQVLHDVIA